MSEATSEIEIHRYKTILFELREEYITMGKEVFRFQRMLGKDTAPFATEHAAALAASGVDAMIADDGVWPEGGVKQVIRTFAIGVLKEGVVRSHSEMTKLELRTSSPETLWSDIIGSTGAADLLKSEP